MKETLPVCCLLAALAAVTFFVLPGDAQDVGLETIPTSGVVTLYAEDDLLSSFSFSGGCAGGRIVDGELVLDDAQMAFDVFAENMITFGFVRDARTRILDLGDVSVPPRERAVDRAPKLPTSLFQTLFLSGAHFSYLDPTGREHRFKDASEIMNALPTEGIYHLEPIVGHTYLVRTNRKGEGTPDELAKFQVIDFRPGRSLTIRWANISAG